MALVAIMLVAGSFLTGLADASEGPVSVRLDHGTKEDFRWAVFAHREKSGSPRRPCVVVLSERTGEGSEETETCGPVEPIPTLLGHSSGRGKKERTVLAMAFSPRVASVRLWLRGRRSRLVHLKRLGVRQSERTGLMRFRYASRSFAGPYCLQRFATYDAVGNLIDRSPSMGCRA